MSIDTAAAVPATTAVPEIEPSLRAPIHQPMQVRDVQIGFRSRLIMWFMRRLLRPWMAWLIRGSNVRIAKAQLMLASRVCRDSAGLPIDYLVLDRVPGHAVGTLGDTAAPVLLYLHGGAFILPAVPEVHVTLMARLCRSLNAAGFMADYRLAPFNKFPAALDDAERAYEALLKLGYDGRQIVVAGESAGGNLTLGLLQRIRRNGWSMPACAVCISPATEVGRIHAPPSRPLKAKRDPILPIAALALIDPLYAGGHDASDPELSPLYMDCRGLPPLYLLASDAEVLLDDTVLLARRARSAGVDVTLDVWPLLPHAFPLFESVFPEVRPAREEIAAFMRQQLDRAAAMP